LNSPGPISASLDVPESISLSLAHKLNSRLELLGDLTWTGWSRFNELLITEAETGKEVTRVPEKWQDVTRVSIGANYQYNDRLTLRTGLAFDQEPIPSARYTTPRIPGNDRKWLSLGAGYKVNKKISIDVGYSHLFMDETAIDNPGESGYSAGLFNTESTDKSLG
jgi:long-chain fatty acid transport protein